MKVELKEVTVRELVDGYNDNGEDGVVGFDGNLDIRPPYQREFIYDDDQRESVIDSITKDYPLNAIYWAVNNDCYEIIDGQQRTLSICQYIDGVFSYDNMYFSNLKQDQKDNILNYKLMIYLCEGDESEKLEWFKTINIAGEELTDQELYNAVYSGEWVSDAKRYFSKTNCQASNIAKNLITGSPIRQDYLETVIKWINNGDVEEYMSKHQHDANAVAIWNYFQSVISWVKATFTVDRKFMKGINWGVLYNEFKDTVYDPKVIEGEIARLVLDDDVSKKSGMYPYVLTRNEKYLSIRNFTLDMKQKLYEKQNSVCPVCMKIFELSDMEADHITPWHEGGKTNEDNCQMLCKECNRRKSGK